MPVAKAPVGSFLHPRRLPDIQCKACNGGPLPLLLLFYSNNHQTTTCPSLKHPWGVSCIPGGFQSYNAKQIEVFVKEVLHQQMKWEVVQRLDVLGYDLMLELKLTRMMTSGWFWNGAAFDRSKWPQPTHAAAETLRLQAAESPGG